MKQFLLSAALLLLTFIGFGQCPEPGEFFQLTYQYEVDDFWMNQGNNCDFTDVDFIIGDYSPGVSNITNLNGLSGFLITAKSLTIQNTQLVNLQGLDLFNYANDFLHIKSNPQLQNLTGLFSDFTIFGLDDLANMRNGRLLIEDNPLLQSLQGLEEVFNELYTNTPVEVKINNNSSLTNLVGLDSLRFVDELNITNNSSLSSLAGLINIKGVENLNIVNNDTLQFLDLPNELQIYGDESITITGNDALLKIDTFEPFANNSGIGVSITILNNPLLSECSVNYICDALLNSTSVSISNNAVGCNSQAEVQANCGICPGAGGVTLSSQAEVDAFPTNYPGCSKTKYNVSISGADINDLSPLLQLDTVGSLVILNNDILENLSGLDNLRSMMDNTNIIISNNLILENVSALANFENTQPVDLTIQNNPQLSSLSGFASLQGIMYIVFIDNNDSLENLNGLEGITLIDELVLRNNDNLNTVSSFINLNRTGSLEFINNDYLETLDFPNDLEFFGSLYITDNAILNNIDTFKSNSNFTDELIIENNPNLSYCSIEPICSNLNNPVLSISISNNAGGCNTQNEIEVNCGTFTTITNFITGAWDNGIPDASALAVIQENYNTGIQGSIDANRLIIEENLTVTVAANTYINIESSIAVDGNLVVEHQGSVVQQNELANTFNNNSVEVELTTPDLASRDFMVLGSPMTASERAGVWNNAFLVLNHDTSNFLPHPDVTAQFPDAENFADDNGDFWNAYTGTVNVGEGYIVRPQTGYGQPGGIFNYTYDSGTLNNGPVTRPVIYNTPGPTAQDNKIASPNIVANPYPSAIWANDFINANPTVDEIYFWEHNTPPSPDLPGAGSMSFSMQDISMYNLSGGIAAASGGTEPNGYIATGQGFAFKANAAGTAVFNNTMRRTDNNNTLRTSNISDRAWLKVNSWEYEMGSTTLLAFGKNTTAWFDPGYDSKRLGTAVSIFSQIEGETSGFGIQTREQLYSGMSIHLGFSTIIDKITEYEISLENFEGAVLENSQIYLLDTLLNKMVNLREEVYAFTSNSGTFKDRFVLYFENETLTLNEFDISNAVKIFPNPVSDNLTISIDSNFSFIKAEIYSISGQKLMETSALQIDMNDLSAGIYFVTVVTESGSITKKIVKH